MVGDNNQFLLRAQWKGSLEIVMRQIQGHRTLFSFTEWIEIRLMGGKKESLYVSLVHVLDSFIDIDSIFHSCAQ